jgi:hypothetical protein
MATIVQMTPFAGRQVPRGKRADRMAHSFRKSLPPGSLGKALDDQDVRKRLFEIGCDVLGRAKRGEQPLAALVKSEIAR